MWVKGFTLKMADICILTKVKFNLRSLHKKCIYFYINLVALGYVVFKI